VLKALNASFPTHDLTKPTGVWSRDLPSLVIERSRKQTKM